jgi:excisionase family DNA binding protein
VALNLVDLGFIPRRRIFQPLREAIPNARPYRFGVPVDDLTLQQVADELGVHYMTAYRYVRLGQLEAVKVGGEWRVSRQALEAFRAVPAEPASPRRQRQAPWSERLEARLLVGDATGAWGVIESAMTGGVAVGDVYTDVLAPALRKIGERWAAGDIDIAVEHRASGIATRIVGRLGSRAVRRGRPRGTIVVGSPSGERHALVVAMLADLLRLEGWDVCDLGADTPSESFVHVLSTMDDVTAVGLSVTDPSCLDACAATCAALHRAGVSAPIYVGGQAIASEAHATELGADGYAADAATLVRLLEGGRRTAV